MCGMESTHLTVNQAARTDLRGLLYKEGATKVEIGVLTKPILWARWGISWATGSRVVVGHFSDWRNLGVVVETPGGKKVLQGVQPYELRFDEECAKALNSLLEEMRDHGYFRT